jgi:PhnB protein
MAKNVKPIPEGYNSITPYLMIQGADKAIDFYKRAFGAKESVRIPGPEGTVGHAEIKIGDSTVMLTEEMSGMGHRGPRSLGGTPVSLVFYVEDADAMFERAVKAGAKVQRPLENMFYGDRMGSLEDPFGHVWHISTHVEDVPEEELRKRAESMLVKG